MSLGGVISNLLSLGAKLLPAVNQFSLQPSSSSSPSIERNQIESELKQLMRLLERIKATLYDAEEREIRDLSVKLWLKELRGVAYDAEDVLDEYHYEVLRMQVEAIDASPSSSRKWKLPQVPNGMLDQIQQIRTKFAEIEKDRLALRLSEEEGPRRCNSDMQIAPTSHFVVESDIIGREKEKEKLIDLLSSESHDGETISVVAIVGTGGIGKTTLAQLVYKDQRIRQKFDKFGWICVSEDFNLQRLTREVVESITRMSCDMENLSALQENISKEIRGKRVFLVLDDVWNENKSHWESFRILFMSASLVKILVTTRNVHVARIMQTMPTFNLSYMSEEQSWKMFQHYAFGEIIHNTSSNFVEIGKKIMKKCGLLPLAVKSIASLLRHEPKEQSWVEILGSELWESNAANEIFPPLQISYARLPTYLKPCFLYCSMFPKDYRYSTRELVKLWISQGYVQTNGSRNAEKIGWEYVRQLSQRSLFEGEYGEKEFHFTLHDMDHFTLHDMVHDLARFNSGHGCYFIERNTTPKFPEELYHLYVGNWVKLVEPPLSGRFGTLRTLVMEYSSNETLFNDFNFLFLNKEGGLSHPVCFDFSKAQKLRALQLAIDLEYQFSYVNLKHLRYLFLSDGHFERLPECICSFYNLQNLTLMNCSDLTMLPESIGNLISLEELTLFECEHLTVLPTSLCELKTLRKLNIGMCYELGELPSDMGNLTNLQLLNIYDTKVSSLPPSLNKIIRMPSLKVWLSCRTVGWLEDFEDIGGELILSGLGDARSLEDLYSANLASMHNLQGLELLWWEEGDAVNFDRDALQLNIHNFGDASSEINHHEIMVMLQPHSNLKELAIESYSGLTFSDWIGNPSLCASLESIQLSDCRHITFLPFGSLPKLKYLELRRCDCLKFIHAESLPLVLEEIEIDSCESLISVMGIQSLKYLVRLNITYCRNMCWLDPCGKADAIMVSGCPKLRELCSRLDINYKLTFMDHLWSKGHEATSSAFFNKARRG